MKNQMYIALLVLPLLAGCGNKKETCAIFHPVIRALQQNHICMGPTAGPAGYKLYSGHTKQCRLHHPRHEIICRKRGTVQSPHGIRKPQHAERTFPAAAFRNPPRPHRQVLQPAATHYRRNEKARICIRNSQRNDRTLALRAQQRDNRNISAIKYTHYALFNP